MKTEHLYYDDPYMTEFESKVININNRNEVVLDASAFFPRGGGQPEDKGSLQLNGSTFNVIEVKKYGETIYHKLDGVLSPDAIGKAVYGKIDWNLRYSYMKHHAALHILNALMLMEFNALVTGAQIGQPYSRMDFKLDRGLTPEERKNIEDSVNSMISENLAINIKHISAGESMQMSELKRTLNKDIPKTNGKIRVVEIENVDQQCCGGLHPKRTAELGQFKIQKIDNKGRDNRRIKITLL